MKIEKLISKVLYKAAPMEPAEFQDLEMQMSVWFDTQKQSVKQKEIDAAKDGKEPIFTLKEKAFKLLDQWYMRALFAAAYIFIIRWVQDFMNPSEPEYDDQPHDFLDSRERR